MPNENYNPMQSLKNLRNPKRNKNCRLPAIICADGFSVSIQGGFGLYSDPREAVPGKRYKELELGFPSKSDSLIQKYMEVYKENHCPTDAVYPFVPVDVIAQLIRKHGGLDAKFKNSPKAQKLFSQSSPFLAVWNILAGV